MLIIFVLIILLIIIISLISYIFVEKKRNKKNFENRIKLLCLTMDFIDFQIMKTKENNTDDELLEILRGVLVLLERTTMYEVPEKIENFGVVDWYKYSNFKYLNLNGGFEDV